MEFGHLVRVIRCLIAVSDKTFVGPWSQPLSRGYEPNDKGADKGSGKRPPIIEVTITCHGPISGHFSPSGSEPASAS
jgi:hypothetical protein